MPPTRPLKCHSFYTFAADTVRRPSLEFPPSVAVLLVHQEVEVILLDVSGLCVLVCVCGRVGGGGEKGSELIRKLASEKNET